MSCRAHEEDVLLYAAGGLEGAERDALESHLATGCPHCAAAVAEAAAVIAHLATSAAPATPSPDVRTRLLARVREDASRRAGAGRERADRRSRWTPARAGFAAALAAGLAGVATWFGVAEPLRRDRDLLAAERVAQAEQTAQLERGVATRDERIAQLEEEATRASETVRLLQSNDVQVVPLRGGASQPDASGRVFFDRARGRWYFHASNLRPAGPGRTYELWFIDATEKKIPAGTFDADARGEAALVVDVPSDAGTLALAAVTNEPAGGVPQPTGEIQLVGQIP